MPLSTENTRYKLKSAAISGVFVFFIAINLEQIEKLAIFAADFDYANYVTKIA